LIAEVRNVRLRVFQVGRRGVQVLREQLDRFRKGVLHHAVGAEPQAHGLRRRNSGPHVQPIAELEMRVERRAARLRRALALPLQGADSVERASDVRNLLLQVSARLAVLDLPADAGRPGEQGETPVSNGGKRRAPGARRVAVAGARTTYNRYFCASSESCWIRSSAPCSSTAAATSSKKMAAGILSGAPVSSSTMPTFAAAAVDPFPSVADDIAGRSEAAAAVPEPRSTAKCCPRRSRRAAAPALPVYDALAYGRHQRARKSNFETGEGGSPRPATARAHAGRRSLAPTRPLLPARCGGAWALSHGRRRAGDF
jgi:hypothetical protein